ncbi:MAG: metallophosphoesterase [Candidatus Nanoarchaeia archaeon]
MKTEIYPGIEIIDLALWLPKQRILAFSDFHIGYEDALNARGILIPKYQLADTLERIKKIFTVLGRKPKTIIINGDLKHEFSTVNKEEFFGVKDLLNLLAKNCEKIIIIKGNHDTILNYAKRVKVEIKEYFLIDNILFAHGDNIVNVDSKYAKIIVVGHGHPTLKLSDGFISEKVKCFLKGKWKGKVLIMQPSFNLVTEGADILLEEGKLPLSYSKAVRNWEAWAIPKFNKVLYFGEIKNLL